MKTMVNQTPRKCVLGFVYDNFNLLVNFYPGISVKMLADKIGRGSTRTCDFPLEEVDVSKYIQPRNPHFIAKLRAGPKRNILVIISASINCCYAATVSGNLLCFYMSCYN